AIAHKSFAATNRDARRRLFLLFAGAAASITPALVLIVAGLLRGRSVFQNESAVLTFALFLMLLGFPLTIAYVIVVHRAMDVRVVIRQGLQYLLASKGAVVLQVVLSAAVIVTAASMS